MKKFLLSVVVVLGAVAGVKANDKVNTMANYTGSYTEFHQDGSVKSVVDVQHGQLNGEMRVYDNDGNISEVRSFKNNLKDGTWVAYKDGKCYSIATYKNDKLNGYSFSYDLGRNMLYQMTYVNNKLVNREERAIK